MFKKIKLFTILLVLQTTLQAQVSIEVFRSEYEKIGDEIYDLDHIDEGVHNYSITAGNSNNYYQIDSVSGIISIQNIINDSFNIVHTDVLTVEINSSTYTITIRDAYDYYINNLDPSYVVLNEHNETFIENSNEWTAINNLWGRGDAIPNEDFRIATIYNPNLPNSSTLIWDVPSKAEDFNGASVWNYNNLFWGNRKNVREDLIGFPFQISSINLLSVDFDFEQLFGNEKFKIAMNMFMTDEDILTNFSNNDGDFFFVFDQNGTFIPNYSNSLPDINIDGKPFAVRYDLNSENGYERRRVIVKDNQKYMSGSLDVKSLFDMFADQSFLNEDQFIYHLQFGIEVTEGFGALRFNQLNVNSNIASIYYVDQQNGNDSNDGTTPTTAFQTFAQAQGAVTPGDTIKIIGEYHNTSYNSTYTFGAVDDSHLWHKENSIKINELHGTASQPITIMAYDSNTVLKGDGANIFRITNSSYLNIEDFNIQGEVDNIPLSTANALQFAYLIDDSNLQGTATNPNINDIRFRNEDETNDNDNIVEETDTYTDISNEPVVRPSYIDTRGLYLSNCNNINITNNNIHHTPGGGLRVSESKYVDIIGNEVYRCSAKSYSGTHALVVTKTEPIASNDYSVRIQKNNIHHNYNEQFSWAPDKTIITPRIDEGKGISLQRNNTTNWINGTGRILVENNICYWNGFSGVHSNDGYRIDFINNTCYLNSYTNTVTYAGQEQRGNNIGISAQSSNDIKMINNISVIDTDWGGFALSAGDTQNLIVSDNMIFGFNGVVSQDLDITSIDVNTTIVDPIFVDETSFDFNLQSNSQAIGAANITYAPTEDFSGFTRDSNPDLGALENNLNPPISPQEMVINMGRGINAGNVMSAPIEGNWAPAFTEDYFIDIKNAGFTTVRIPMDFFGTRTSGDTTIYSSNANTESDYSNNPMTFTVNSTYLDRVEQVITWALDNNLITILDFHGATLKSEFIETFDSSETAYTNPTSAKRAADNDKFRSIWTQIANRFKNYDYNLLFEIINEPYFHISATEMDILNLDLISIIRNTGNKNNNRNIIITGGSENSYEAPLQIGTSVINSDNNLIATYHYYWPRSFTASSEETHNDYDWGTATDKVEIDTNFGAVQSWSQTNAIPILLGEFGADNEGGYNYDTGTYGSFGGPENASRVEYHRYLAQKAIDLGFAFTAWDAGHKSNKTIYKVNDRTWVEDVKDALLGLTSNTFTFDNGTWTPSNPSGVTTSIDNIHVVSGNANSDNINALTNANNLTINSGAKLVINTNGSLNIESLNNNGDLTIRSNSTSSGSLIVNSIVSQGLINYRKYVNAHASSGGNDLISAPLTGENFGDFAFYNSNEENIYSNPSNTNEKLFGPFNKSTGQYQTYNIVNDANILLQPAIGYRAASDPASTNSNGIFVFTGNLTIDTVNHSIQNSGPAFQRWNLIGNPYTSYLDFEAFYNTNTSQLDDGVYNAIYGYDGDAADGWTIWNQLTIQDTSITELIVPGQGFFVASKSGGGTITFSPEMRRNGFSDDFITTNRAITTNIARSTFKLNKNSNEYFTDIYFVENATQGVDSGYDAAAFGGSNSIFTTIVDGSSQEELAIQALPYLDFNDVMVPLGVKANVGEQITISLDTETLTVPSNIYIYLEDSETNVWTLLNDSDYSLTPQNELTGTGRFYIHFESELLSSSENILNDIDIIYNQNNKQLIIKGMIQKNGKLTLFDLKGRMLNQYNMDININRQTFNLQNLSSGVYIVNINNDINSISKKIIIK